MLFTMEEIQKIIWLFSRAGLNQVELEWANSFFQRLVTFCQPPKPENDALAVADALDKIDEEVEK